MWPHWRWVQYYLRCPASPQWLPRLHPRHPRETPSGVPRGRKTAACNNACILRIPPPRHDYPYYWVILDPKSEEDKVKVTNLKNSPKFQIFNFETNITRNTPSEVAWYDMQTWNGSDEYCWRCRADTILSTDGQMDRRTDGRLWRIWSQLPWNKLHRILASSFLSSWYRVICVHR